MSRRRQWRPQRWGRRYFWRMRGLLLIAWGVVVVVVALVGFDFADRNDFDFDVVGAVIPGSSLPR